MQNPLLSSKPAKLAPALVIVNATIRTMDGKNPHAGALAILGNRIVAVGQTEAVRSLAGGKTRIINAGKKLVLPGLNDAHVHFLSGGFSRAQVDLRDAKSPGELAQRLRDYARKTPRDRWILGG